MHSTKTSFLLDTAGIPHTKQPPLRYCGHCQSKAVLMYNDIPFDSYRTLACNRISNYTGFMWPHNFKRMQRIYGIPTKVGRAKNITDHISWIKNMIIHSTQPLILQIAHGYRVKKGTLMPKSWLRMITMHHWISVRGFDDDKEVFYVYDTAFPSPDGSLTNIELPYQELLYYRQRGIFGMYNYLYVYFGKQE